MQPGLVGLAVVAVMAALALGDGTVWPPVLESATPFSSSSDSSAFATLRTFGLATGEGAQVALLTERTLVALTYNTRHEYTVPPSLAAPVAMLSVETNRGSQPETTYCLYMLPFGRPGHPLSLQPALCSSPFEGTCEMEPMRPTTIPHTNSSSIWRDVSYATDGATLILAADTFVVVVWCEFCECTYNRTISFTSLTRHAADFPYLISALTYLENNLWLFLTSDLAHLSTAPGLLIAVDIGGGMTEFQTSLYLQPGAASVIIFQTLHAQILSVSARDPATSDASFTTFYVWNTGSNNKLVINPFPLNDSALESFPINGAASPGSDIGKDANPGFIVTDSTAGPSVLVYSHVIGSSLLTSEPAVARGYVFGGITALYTSTLTSSGELTYIAYVGAKRADTGENELLVFHAHQFGGASSTMTPTDTSSYSAVDAEGALRAFALGQISERELDAVLGDSGRDGASACNDPSQPPTCLMACAALPATICGPTVAPPPGYECFVLPTHPDACNNCPIQYSGTCG